MLTVYRIFRHDPETSGYMVVGEQAAHDARSAIETVIVRLPEAEADSASGVTFAAVPVSRWTEKTAAVERQLRVRLT